jgi:hypothetical protein
MRNIPKYAFLILLAVLATVMAGCPQLLPFNPLLAADQTAETALFTQTSTNDAAADATGNPFVFVSTSGTLTADDGEIFQLVFYQGVVDSSSIASGIAIYPLVAAADANTVWGHGTPLTFTAEVVPELIDAGTMMDSRVVITINLNITGISSRLEISIDPTLLTANGGAKLLNMDGDGVAGEAGEDDVVTYIAVGTGTVTPFTVPVVVTPGLDRDTPNNGNSPNFAYSGGYAATSTSLTFNASDSRGGTNVTAASLMDAVSIEKLGADGTWSTVTPASKTLASGVITATLSTALARGEIYRVKSDLYEIKESAAVAGYIHRMGYDQNNSAARYVYSGWAANSNCGPVDVAFDSAVTITDGGAANSRWFQIDFTCTAIKMSTITTSTVRLYDITAARWVNWATDVKMTSSAVRFVMPSSFAGTTGNTYTIYISPLVTDDGADTTVTTDDVPFGSLTRADAFLVSATQTW